MKKITSLAILFFTLNLMAQTAQLKGTNNFTGNNAFNNFVGFTNGANVYAMDGVGRFTMTNLANGAYWIMGTNGHYRGVDQFGNLREWTTNRFTVQTTVGGVSKTLLFSNDVLSVDGTAVLLTGASVTLPPDIYGNNINASNKLTFTNRVPLIDASATTPGQFGLYDAWSTNYNGVPNTTPVYGVAVQNGQSSAGNWYTEAFPSSYLIPQNGYVSPPAVPGGGSCVQNYIWNAHWQPIGGDDRFNVGLAEMWGPNGIGGGVTEFLVKKSTNAPSSVGALFCTPLVIDGYNRVTIARNFSQHTIYNVAAGVLDIWDGVDIVPAIKFHNGGLIATPSPRGLEADSSGNLFWTDNTSTRSQVFVGSNASSLTNMSVSTATGSLPSASSWKQRLMYSGVTNALTSGNGTNYVGIPANKIVNIGDKITFDAMVYSGSAPALRSVMFQVNNTNVFSAGRKLGSSGVNWTTFQGTLKYVGLTNAIIEGLKMTSAGGANMNDETQTGNPDRQGVPFYFDPTVTNNLMIYDTGKDGKTIVEWFDGEYSSATQ